MIQADLRALLQAAGEPPAQPPPAVQLPAAVTVGTGQPGQSIPSTGAVLAGKCTSCVLCMCPLQEKATRGRVMLRHHSCFMPPDSRSPPPARATLTCPRGAGHHFQDEAEELVGILLLVPTQLPPCSREGGWVAGGEAW